MQREIRRFLELWSPESIDKLKRKGYGVMNCRSGLGGHHSIETEIRQRIEDAFPVTSEEERPIFR